MKTYDERCAEFLAGLQALTNATGVAVDVEDYDDPYISVQMFMRDAQDTPGEYADDGALTFTTNAERDAAIARSERAKRAAETRKRKRTLAIRDTETFTDYSARIRAEGFKACGAAGCNAVVPLESPTDERMFGLCDKCRIRLREETGLR